MKGFGKRWLLRAGGWGAAQLIGGLMSTLRYRGAYYDRTVDPALPSFHGPIIFLFWHEYIPFLFFLRRHCHLAMLVSQHGDAEFLSQAASFRGFEAIRGSTTRGGVTAIRTLMEKAQGLNIAITPDGPQGPRRQLAPGSIYLASRLQIPLVPIGLGYDRPWRYKRAWDQFAIPKPNSRARAIAAPPILVPPDLEKEQLGLWRQYVEDVLNLLTHEAEQWAADDLPRIGQQPLFESPAATRRPRLASRIVPAQPNAPLHQRTTLEPDSTPRILSLRNVG